MSKTPSHIIQRQCIELQMPTRLPHLQIQDDAIALFKDVLRARIGECLDRLFPGEELVQLDTIVIDLGRISAADWEETFVERFVEEFELVLESAQNAHAVEAAARGMANRQAAQSAEGSGERGPWAALSYFLAHGFLPWWHVAHDKSSIQDLVKALLAQEDAQLAALRQRMRETFSEAIVLQRLVHALPDTLLAALAKALERLSPQAENAMGALTRLLTLPAHGISRTEARIALWQEILGGAPAAEPLLPEEILAAAILQLAGSTEQAPEALLHAIASDDPQLSGASLRDLALVQARLAAHPTQAFARAYSPALRRAAEALQAWLLQADAQLFDVDKALSLLRDLQAALSPGELRDSLAQVIEQLNAARRQRPAAPLQVPSVNVLKRLAHAMREEASQCPAPLLLSIQDFYLRISLLQAPEMQESLLAAPLQHLALEIMRLRASAGTSNQGPYLQAAARQLLEALDARELARAGMPADTATQSDAGKILASEADKNALSRSAAVLPAPSLPATQAHACAWIAAQIAEQARTELAAPAALNLATWRAWFKSLRSPELRPLLGHATWRDLLQAISELLGGQAPGLQLRSILQLAETLLSAGPTPQLPTSTPATLRTTLEELVQIGDAAGKPKEVAQVQARLRAIAGVLHDRAAAHVDLSESETVPALSWKAAWLPLKASLQALATFGRPTLMAAGVAAAKVDGLIALLGQAQSERAAQHVAMVLAQLLDMGAIVQAARADVGLEVDLKAGFDAGLQARALTSGRENAAEAADGLASRVLELGAEPLLRGEVPTSAPASEVVGRENAPSTQPAPVSEMISPAVQARLTRFLNALIALTASLEVELAHEAAPVKRPVRKQDWRKEWEILREWIVAGDVQMSESAPDSEGMEMEAEGGLGDAAVLSQDGLSAWKSAASLFELDLESATIDASAGVEGIGLNVARRKRSGVERSESIDTKAALDREVIASQVEVLDLGDPATSPSVSADTAQELPSPEVLSGDVLWRSAATGFDAVETEASNSAQAEQLVLADTAAGIVNHLISRRIRRKPLASPNAVLAHKSPSKGLLDAPHHEIQSAEVLVTLAEVLAPAVQDGQLNDAQIAFWQDVPVDLIAGVVASLQTGKLLRSEVETLEKQLQLTARAPFVPQSAIQQVDDSAVLPDLNRLDADSERRDVNLEDADIRNGNEPDASDWVAKAPQLASRNGSDSNFAQNPSDPDPQQLELQSESDSTSENKEAHSQPNYFEAPAFRFLLSTQALKAETTSASINPASPEAQNDRTAPEQEDLPAIAQRMLQPLVHIPPSEIRQAARQAQVDHVLTLLGHLVTHLHADVEGQESPVPSTFAQVRLWVQQFPGQSLPKSLARALGDALAALSTTVSAPAPGIPTQENAAITSEQGHAAAAQVAVLPSPLPQWRAQIDPLAAVPLPQLLGPRPIAILPQHSFAVRRAQLIASMQGLLQMQAPAKGLRRTLDPLTRLHKPTAPAPSLSDTSRQQLAQAAQQAKALLREPLPARLHAALRSLQSGLSGHSPNRPDLKAIQRISNQANTLLQGKKGKSAPREPEKELSIYVKNAGLVLLWPFIQRFFQNLGLVEGREFVSPDAHGRAVLFLQYLADPDPETAEHLLPLCKLLCGYPDDRPIALELAPTEEEIEQCEGLLATVPSHHPAMKNMRVEGFRTAWLQREGALKPRGDHYLLHVEKQAYDVLLEQLPWSIRVIRLPWMHTAILTEW